jgi:hypothetical protein
MNFKINKAQQEKDGEFRDKEDKLNEAINKIARDRENKKK